MTLGVGGSSAAQELEKLSNQTLDIQPIEKSEYQTRIDRACALMAQHDLGAVYLNAGTNLYYFTGTRWHPSERMVGALLLQDGSLHYIAPHFEISTLQGFMLIEGEVHAWHEHQSPYSLFANMLASFKLENNRVGLDESCAFFITDGVAQASPNTRFVNAKPVTAGCRGQKSNTELALLQRAKDITLRVHQAAAAILRPGISTAEVTEFIDQAHRKMGATAGSYFCIVLFGEDSAYPHGVKSPKNLEQDDMVLIDTGIQLEGYNSDITRSYVFGEPNARQREVWDIEKAAQAAAFDAAQLGTPCGNVDTAARDYLTAKGFGPNYDLPGLPHRTGHGIGLDIHEWPYLVGSDQTPLDVGMCFSNEPMICVPGEFGIRLEDHFYMTDSGAKWFTEPSLSIDDPFALAA